MKVLVAYDTYYGNTRLVAEAIADEFKSAGFEAEIRNLKEGFQSPPQGDILVIGTPIRMAHVPRPAKRFVKRLDKESWKGKPIITFTTIGPIKENPTEKEQQNTPLSRLKARSSRPWIARVLTTSLSTKPFRSWCTAIPRKK